MVSILTWCFVLLFGAIVGSFLNVVILRLPRRASIVRPRSRCGSCGTMIRAHDNVPVLSWLALRFRCRACGAPVSIRYPAIELLTAALTAWLVLRTLPADTLLLEIEPARLPRLTIELALVWVLIVATFIDLDHTIIPDEITKLGMVAAPVLSALVPALHGAEDPLAGAIASLYGVAAGAGSILVLRILGRALFRKEAMGFGDVKYMGFLGGMLGVTGVLLTLGFACLLGSIVGLVVLLFRRGHYIPFAPWLSAGAAIVLFFREAVLEWLLETYPAFVRSLIAG